MGGGSRYCNQSTVSEPLNSYTHQHKAVSVVHSRTPWCILSGQDAPLERARTAMACANISFRYTARVLSRDSQDQPPHAQASERAEEHKIGTFRRKSVSLRDVALAAK